MLKNDFKRGQVDTTLFKKTLEKDIRIVQIYVDDIIFGSTNASLCKEFSKLMQEEFEMSMIEVLFGNSNQPMQRWSVCSSIQI